MTPPRLTLGLAAILALCIATPARAQADRDPRKDGQRAQERFETFRRANLPMHRGRSRNECQERVGRFCYWYDEDAPSPPTEPGVIAEARRQLIETLDSLARRLPTDEWLTGQLVRYLDEAGRNEEALEAATRCEAFGWWCIALRGFSLHQLGRYADAEARWDSVLSAMPPTLRCNWLDISNYLDTDTRRRYARHPCGSAEREDFTARIWWLARPRFSLLGNDARSEHFARMTYAQFLLAAPSAYMFGFNEDERELLLRFGWARAWSRGAAAPSLGFGDPRAISVIGHDPTPAYRFIPPGYVINSPLASDSTDWAVQLPPVIARYQPPYAKRLYMLEHQQSLFRRGDTALVVLAYDVSKISARGDASIEAALVAAPSNLTATGMTVRQVAEPRGFLVARAPWGPLLLSAEIAVPDSSVLARARYGIRPPLATGTRVSLSDLLLYSPYGELPSTLEEVLPHAIPTQRIARGAKVGVFWETYGTNPNGERMSIQITVVPETEEATGLRRAARAIRLARESQPVSIGAEDVSARGSSTTPRSLELDLATLRPGNYLMQLEVGIAGQYSIRAERRLVIYAP